MHIMNPINRLFSNTRSLARSALRDRSGISAIEFALILPVMIVMYMGAVELSHALTVDRRVSSVASSIADLAAQTEVIDAGEVQDLFTASTSIMTPYDASPISIVVSSVEANEDNETTVGWSCAHNGSPRSVGSEVTLPNGLTQPFSSVIMAEVTYSYTPPLGEIITGNLTFSETFYLRPRRSLVVEWQGAAC